MTACDNRPATNAEIRENVLRNMHGLISLVHSVWLRLDCPDNYLRLIGGVIKQEEKGGDTIELACLSAEVEASMLGELLALDGQIELNDEHSREVAK
jgi:hypothetical protein